MRKKRIPIFTSKGEWSTFSVFPILKGGRRRVGVAIPRTLIPQSTSRNRLRRQIREAVRILSKELNYQDPKRAQELLIGVKKKGAPSFKAIQRELEHHLKVLLKSLL